MEMNKKTTNYLMNLNNLVDSLYEYIMIKEEQTIENIQFIKK